MSAWFQQSVVTAGKLRLFCFFASFIVTFLFIRLSVRMIRAQVKWWPGNVTPGGVHVHHAVFARDLQLSEPWEEQAEPTGARSRPPRRGRLTFAA